PEFQFEFYGLGSNQLSQDGVDVGIDPYTLDKSGTSNKLAFQAAPDGSGGGTYTPLVAGSGAYVVGRGRSASVDTDLTGLARGATFSAGAFQGAVPTALLPASDRQTSRAASSAAGWNGACLTASGRLASRTTVAAAGWTVALAAAGGRIAGRAGSPAAGWSVAVAPLSARQAEGSAPAAAGWAGALAATTARQAQAAASPSARWAGTLAPATSRMAMSGTTPLIGVASVTLTLMPAGGRLVLIDTPLGSTPPLPPSSRTLIVADPGRTLFIA
ncbi:MAG: hypothetical protein JO290_05070, partial [Sphingomonadaceae bacterium]|nr:hypothetical protein [Sphingomonadaceae bacterium]